jgi:UDP-glucose 4-epimerase
MSDCVLITGGCGYLGSHTVLRLLAQGAHVVVLDNLCNSTTESLSRIEKLTGRSPAFVHGDIRDEALLSRLFLQNKIDAVIHFAGLKSVAESVSDPFKYYENNVSGTMTLCKAMAVAGVFTLVFSSSATVYGDTNRVPLRESRPVGQPNSPYGRTKLVAEQMLSDLATADTRWRIALLRYFNPVGAHDSGLIGEDPSVVPNNLLPYIARVAVGRLPYLTVFGNDYPTPDGTGVRDYIHVVDLAEGHWSAIQALKSRVGAHIWNLGTGTGYSVLEMIKAFEKASNRHIAYRIGSRRPGDVATCYADPSKAERELGWKAQRGLHDMMADTWRWQSMNPDGYRG